MLPEKLKTFFNSSFFNGFIAAVVIGLASFFYSGHQSAVAARDYFYRVNKEISTRFDKAQQFIANYESDLSHHVTQPVSTNDLLTNIKFHLDNKLSLGTYTGSIIPEFQKTALIELIDTLKNRLPAGKEKDSVKKVYQIIDKLNGILDREYNPNLADNQCAPLAAGHGVVNVDTSIKTAKYYVCQSLLIQKWKKEY